MPQRPAALQHQLQPSKTSSRHGIPESCCRDWVKQTLQERGVSTIIYYPIPIHRQPAYAHLDLQQGSLPVTEQLCSQVLSLPIFPELSEEQQEAVIDTVRQLLAPFPAQFDGLRRRSGPDSGVERFKPSLLLLVIHQRFGIVAPFQCTDLTA